MKLDVGQLEFIHKTLRRILTEIEFKTGYEFTLTSLYRMGDNGVHGALPLRGADLRMRNKRLGAVVQDLINKEWLYNPDDPNKVCAILHGAGSNLHLHIQVHNNTVLR